MLSRLRSHRRGWFTLEAKVKQHPSAQRRGSSSTHQLRPRSNPRVSSRRHSSRPPQSVALFPIWKSKSHQTTATLYEVLYSVRKAIRREMLGALKHNDTCTATAFLHAAGPETLSRDLVRSRKEAEEWTRHKEGRQQQPEKLISRRPATTPAFVGAGRSERPRVPSIAEQLPSPSHQGTVERPRTTAGAAVVSTPRRHQPRQSSRVDGEGSTAHHAQPRGRVTHSAPRMQQRARKNSARSRRMRNDSNNKHFRTPTAGYDTGGFPYANSMACDNDRVPRSARDAVRLLRRIRHMKGHDGSKLTDAAARGKAKAGGTEKNSSRHRPRSRGATRTGGFGGNEGTSPATGKGHASPHSASGRPPVRPLLRPGSRANWEKKRDAIVEIMAAFQYDISYDKMYVDGTKDEAVDAKGALGEICGVAAHGTTS